MNIKKWINNVMFSIYPKKNINKNKENFEIIYSKIIDITNCDTDGRQKIIREIIKKNNLDLSDNIQNELLDCSLEIDECELSGNSKRLQVITLLDDDYIYTLGYIPKILEHELYQALDKSDTYNTELYVTKKDNILNLQLEIIFKKAKKEL